MNALRNRCVAAFVLVGMTGWAGGCGRDEARPLDEPPAGPNDRASGSRTPSAERPRIVVLGDSLTSGLGLPAEQAFPSVLQRHVEQTAMRYEVVNAGVSGDTSAGGLRRLEWTLDGDVSVLVLALGANDGLRGLSADQMERNLRTIIERSRARGVDVLLCGMEAPPNFGPGYTDEFRRSYAEVARDTGVRFVPFLLEGIAGNASLNQADGIHPNASGARRMADIVWRELEPMLRAPKPSPATPSTSQDSNLVPLSSSLL
jgi:acyl-CoA thioesterase-1